MIKISNLSISFSAHQIFEDVNVSINSKERIGLIGRNGSGKSTFLKIMMGELEQDTGHIQMPKMYSIGYLEQHIKFIHSSVIEEVSSVLSEERQYEEWKGEEILMGLGFTVEQMLQNPQSFSGGYQVKINLAKVLLTEPNLLLLDEPTNYLDIYSIRWLEKFLKNWQGECKLISFHSLY